MSTPENVIKDPLFLKGLNQALNNYEFFILDIWGVLHDGKKLYPSTLDTLKTLKSNNKKTCLLSNTGHLNDFVINHLNEFGVSRDLYDFIITAGSSAQLALKDRPDQKHKDLGNKCFYIGDDPLLTSDDKFEIIMGMGIEVCEDAKDATFILNSCGGTPHENVDTILSLIEKISPLSLPMVCVNPDIKVNIGQEQYLCAGAFAKRYEALGGHVIYHGKPDINIYNHVWNFFGQPDKTKIVAIGDSLHTDIQGANNFSIDSIWNLAGIHKDEVQLQGQTSIDAQALKTTLHNSSVRPTAYIETFII
jgi:HAD superfamily hydrolase (TIGR01459 family)